jgi:DNA repair protein RadA/Sms
MERRLAEAARQGFTTALIPSGCDAVPPGLQALQAPTIVAALEHMLDIAEHRSTAPTPPHRLGAAATEQNDW